MHALVRGLPQILKVMGSIRLFFLPFLSLILPSPHHSILIFSNTVIIHFSHLWKCIMAVAFVLANEYFNIAVKLTANIEVLIA